MKPRILAADAGPRPYRLVARRILLLIGELGLGPGQRLPPERSLAAMLQVSRSTIREALIALEFDGKLVIAPGSGVYVQAPPDHPDTRDCRADLADLRAARWLVASEVAALAARHAGAAAIDALARAVEAIEAAGSCSGELEAAFMQALAEASGNGALAGLVGCLWQRPTEAGCSQPAPYRAMLAALAAHDRAAVRRALPALAGLRQPPAPC